MIIRGQWHGALAGAGLLAVLLAPPVRHALEASMTAQMLVQIPLLAVAGVLLSRSLPGRLIAAIEPWNRHGLSTLVLAMFASAFWMLPRALDAAATETLVAAAKYASLPLLVGLPLAIAWPRMGFIVKGVFLLECLATLFRLGWLYLASPERLCNSYLLDDQQLLGRCLLVLGTALTLAIAGRLLWGRFDVTSAPCN
ncbi:MAG: hypothetical protein HONDAALG_02167 [Gammaproteobacteria bacterium]|nr:hypothetical protein [Gammaproteobacteria bacterium]